jgi:hypothetical protein
MHMPQSNVESWPMFQIVAAAQFTINLKPHGNEEKGML